MIHVERAVGAPIRQEGGIRDHARDRDERRQRRSEDRVRERIGRDTFRSVRDLRKSRHGEDSVRGGLLVQQLGQLHHGMRVREGRAPDSRSRHGGRRQERGREDQLPGLWEDRIRYRSLITNFIFVLFKFKPSFQIHSKSVTFVA